MSNGPAFLRRRRQLNDPATLASARRDLLSLLIVDLGGPCMTNLLQVARQDIGQLTDL
jgi:hypothetical protein